MGQTEDCEPAVVALVLEVVSVSPDQWHPQIRQTQPRFASTPVHADRQTSCEYLADKSFLHVDWKVFTQQNDQTHQINVGADKN